MSTIEVKVPDIGDFTDIPVIEIFVKPGDTVKAEDSLVTLESDKATMDVPSPAAGTVKEVKVKLGDKVSEGTLILVARERRRRARRTRRAEARRSAKLRRRRTRTAPPPPPAAAAAAAAASPRQRHRTPQPARRRRARRRRSLQGSARIAVGAQVRARTRRRSRARHGHRPEGPHPAGGRAELRQAGDDRRGRRRPAACGTAAAARSICCRGRQVDFAKFGPVEARAAVAHQEDLRREPRAELGDDSARHAVRRGRHHRPRGVPRRAQQGKREGRHQGDDARVPDQGERRGAEEIPGRSMPRSTATTSC